MLAYNLLDGLSFSRLADVLRLLFLAPALQAHVRSRQKAESGDIRRALSAVNHAKRPTTGDRQIQTQ